MKKILSIAIFLSVLAGTADATPPANYKLVWQDEFKGPSLDLSKWHPQTYKRDSAKQTISALTIGKDGLEIHTYTENGATYTGFLWGADNHFLYGYYEARIRFHEAPGGWCAFWLQPLSIGKIIGDPADSGVEVDIIEHRATDKQGKDISNQATLHLHWDGYAAYHKQEGIYWDAPKSLNDNWHVYAVLWTPDEYVFSIDNVERWRTHKAVSRTPQGLRLTCEVKDNSFAGKIPDGGYGTHETSPYHMDVNWVRVWQKAQ